MKAFDRQSWLLFLGLVALTACSKSDSPPSPATVEPSTIEDSDDQGDLETKHVTHTADLPSEALIAVDETVETYFDGTVHRTSESYTDEAGQRILHGAFVEFYPNGNRFCAGRYAHGKRNGPWKYWHQDGQTARIASFEYGLADGTWIWYRPDGTRSRQASYASGQLHGDSITYTDDGQAPSKVESYRAGRRHGLLSRWHESGQKLVEIEFKDGVPDGHEIRWHVNGQKRVEGHHRAGSPDGVFNYWASDGTPIKSVEWRNGRRVGRLVDRSRRES